MKVIVAGLALLLSCAHGPARSEPPPEELLRWQDSYPLAASELCLWQRAHPQETRRLLEWERDNPVKAQELMQWAATHPGFAPQPYFRARRWEGDDVLSIGPALNGLAEWAARHPDAALDFTSDSRKLDWTARYGGC